MGDYNSALAINSISVHKNDVDTKMFLISFKNILCLQHVSQFEQNGNLNHFRLLRAITAHESRAGLFFDQPRNYVSLFLFFPSVSITYTFYLFKFVLDAVFIFLPLL